MPQALHEAPGQGFVARVRTVRKFPNFFRRSSESHRWFGSAAQSSPGAALASAAQARQTIRIKQPDLPAGIGASTFASLEPHYVPKHEADQIYNCAFSTVFLASLCATRLTPIVWP